MISWMQRHKKYLIITIWISTISFVGAGFVGWGQYSYGDKATSVAKVGDIEISRGELQKAYSNLYAQYNAMFQGNFDEEQAEKLQLKRQAIKKLIDQALLLNFADEYGIIVNDKEVLQNLLTQKYFFKNGVFDKEVYKQVLLRNNLTPTEYEAEVKKQLKITKLLKLFHIDVNKNEPKIFETFLNIADKLKYKILDPNKIKVDTSDDKVKQFWETKKQNFMTEVKYKIEYIKQKKVHKTYDDTTISQYYNKNKLHFRDKDGKILPLASAKDQVIAELDAKTTKKEALKIYIAYKKEKLEKTVKKETLVISISNNPLGDAVFNKVSKLSTTKPYAKPLQVQDDYYIIKLQEIIPAQTKTYKEAKSEVLPLYVETMKKQKVLELAKKSFQKFQGQESEFITIEDVNKIKGLTPNEANEFLPALFMSDAKDGFIPLQNGKVILYNILEQKLLNKKHNDLNNSIVEIKKGIFNDALIKNLQHRYQIEIFLKGL